MRKFKLTLIIMVATITATVAQPLTINQNDSQGRKTGYWLEKLPEGNYSGIYSDNLKEGAWTLRASNNNALLRLESFIHGKKNGASLDLNQQGQVTGEKFYVDELLEGPAKTFFWGTQVSTLTNYKNGKLDGKKQVYYENSNGKLQEESNYKDGVKEGESKWYSNNGDSIALYNYKDGKLDGIQKMYYPGNKLMSEQAYTSNIESGPFKEYFENGKVKIESNYSNGKMEGKYTEYDQDGVKVTEGIYVGGLQEGKWISFDKNGKIVKTRKYLKGVEQK